MRGPEAAGAACVYVSQHFFLPTLPAAPRSSRYARSRETETRLAHARTNRRFRVSHTCRQLRQALHTTHEQLEAAAFGVRWGEETFEPLEGGVWQV